MCVFACLMHVRGCACVFVGGERLMEASLPRGKFKAPFINVPLRLKTLRRDGWLLSCQPWFLVGLARSKSHPCLCTWHPMIGCCFKCEGFVCVAFRKKQYSYQAILLEHECMILKSISVFGNDIISLFVRWIFHWLVMINGLKLATYWFHYHYPLYEWTGWSHSLVMSHLP